MKRVRLVKAMLGLGAPLFLVPLCAEGAAPDLAAGTFVASEPGVVTRELGSRGDDGFARQELDESLLHSHVERMQVARRVQAHTVDFFAPFYSIEGLRDTRLFLLNTIADPILVALVARSEGRELPLGSYPIEPQRHLEISLRERLVGFEDDFQTGNLRLSLLGDADTLQGWAVVTEPDGQTFELPLVSPEKSSSREYYGFWDVAPLGVPGKVPVAFHVLNTSTHERSMDLTFGEAGRGDSAALLLQPGEAVSVRAVGKVAFGHRGWLKMKHDGQPGDVLGVGIVGDRTLVAAVPLIPRGAAEASKQHESLPMPIQKSEAALRAGAPRHGWLTLLNVGPGGQEVLLEALDATSGASIARSSILLEPWEVTAFALARVMPRGIDSRQARLRVQGNAQGLLVRGMEIASPGLAADLPFFSAYHAHGNGTYPLAALERYETVTPIVNLGEEASDIVAQVYWDGGTFALGPITIPAGASHVIDLEELAKTAPPDLLGRTLDPNRPPAVLKWTVTSGSTRLLGRTLVRPRGSGDLFGFNCFGCCIQNPKGRVVPSAVNFYPGQSEVFDVAVVYTTCSGEMGPYPTTPSSLTVPSPFTWNGHTVGASGPALEILSFTGSGTKIASGCQEFTVNFTGAGTASSCDDHLQRPDSPGASWDPTKTCSSQTANCDRCQACCHQIYNWKVCKRIDPNMATSERNTCIGVCLSDRC